MTTATQARRQPVRTEEPEWLVWLLVIVLLAAGAIVRTAVTGRTQPVSQGNVSLTIPATWAVLSPSDGAEVSGYRPPVSKAAAAD